ncbi:SET and MYND domain-containing protein 4 [Armigeres subalbatus]|uniref:SET and MYND domain-containing protein 4 n=1 Tax=Armigeres subalbatus TaxID=124917 RepID=UPI002ED2E98F
MASIDNDPLYTELCSDKTLSSQKEGFFNAFYWTVAENFTGQNEHWLRDVFGKVQPGNDSARVQLIYEDPVVCFEVLGTLEHVKPVFRGKDAKFSWQRREQATKLLNEGKMQQALILASQAVMRAPAKCVDMHIDQGMTLACAFWTRAEVLIRMLDGVHALRDLQMAAKAGFPVKANGEYYGKMAKCYALMGDLKRAEVSAKLFHQLAGLDDYRLQRLREDLEDLRTLKEEDSAIKPQGREPKLPDLAGGENQELKGASKKIALSGALKDSQKGRYIVAAEDLQPGETVLTEAAYGACLYPKFFGTHCNLCFSRLVASVPCEQCCGVAFCSPECRDRACTGYHRFECQYLDLMIGSGMSILCHLALRLITQAGTAEKAIEITKDLALCSHAEHRSHEDYFRRTLMAAFLLRCLQKSEFFGRRKTEAAEPTPIEAKVGGVILELLQSLQFNAHEIYEMRVVGDHRIDSAKVQYTGVGVYRTGSLLNHDCHSGVSRSFLKTTMILHTSRPLAKGSSVPENYGMHFMRQPLSVRQKVLRSRYWFKCDCKACVEDWPLLDKIPDKPKLRCPHPDCSGVLVYTQKGKCYKCKNNVNFEGTIKILQQCENLYDEGAKKMLQERVEEAAQLFSKGINLFYTVAVPPHKTTHVAEESLRSCYADFGNKTRV